MADKEILRVTIIGAGGIGSWLAHGLARQMEYQRPGSAIIIVDGDTYEPKNVERQTFTAMGNKADVIAADLTTSGQFPRTMFIPQPYWVVEEGKGVQESDETEEDGSPAAGKIPARELLHEGAVVFNVVDNYAARKIVFDAAQEFENIDVFTGGNDDKFETFVYHYRRRNGIDVTDHPVLHHPEYESPPDRNPGEMSCEERAKLEGGGQFVATNMTVAGLLLTKAQREILLDTPRVEETTEYETNVDEFYFDASKGMASARDRTAVPSVTKVGA